MGWSSLSGRENRQNKYYYGDDQCPERATISHIIKTNNFITRPSREPKNYWCQPVQEQKINCYKWSVSPAIKHNPINIDGLPEFSHPFSCIAVIIKLIVRRSWKEVCWMSERAALANHPEFPTTGVIGWCWGNLREGKQALRSSYEVLRQRNIELQSSWDCMQAHGTAYKVMELHASSRNCMQAHGTACACRHMDIAGKLMQLQASPWINLEPWGSSSNLGLGNLEKPWENLGNLGVWYTLTGPLPSHQ